MSHAQVCPVCNGTGAVYGIAEKGAYPTSSSSIHPTSALCHGCGGKGYIVVEDGETRKVTPDIIK